METRQGGDRPEIGLKYSRFDKLRLIENGDQGDVTFVYDADQERILKTSQNASTVYLPGMFYRITPTGSGDAVFNYLISNEERIVTQIVKRDSDPEDREVYYHHDDALGSSLLITDEDAEVVESSYYSAFGELVDSRSRGQDITNVGYTGHEFDQEYALINMGGRIYDPELARILTLDPLVVTRVTSHSDSIGILTL